MKGYGAVRILVLIALCAWAAPARAQTLITTTTTFDNVIVPFPSGTLDINGSGIPTLFLLNSSTLTSGITSLTVGNTQTGRLFIGSGSIVSNSGQSLIGAGATGSGAVTVTGAGSQWNSNSILVGYGGFGTLSITSGGVVTGSLGSIGLLPTATGTATVSGAGSQWRLNDSLAVGDFGRGTLIVENGGTIVTGDLTVGSSTGAIGDVLITGANTQLTVTNSTLLGFNGRSTMTVADGGLLQANIVYMAGTTGSTSALTVTGGNSLALLSGELRVGDRGQANLTIGGGGRVSSTQGSLGFTAGTGSVVISGAGSQWTVTDRMFLAQGGNGSMLVTLGGQLVTGTTFVGSGTSGVGNVTISGNGSNWTVTNGLYVGGIVSSSRGTGTVTVMGGGVLEVGGTLKLWNQGTLTITDGNVLTRDFDRSTGTFNLLNGSISVSGGVYTHTTGSGGAGNILAINGATAADLPSMQLINTTVTGVEAIVVGADRRGELLIGGGTVITNTGTNAFLGSVGGNNIFRTFGYIGHGATGSGSVTVSGLGSVWTLSSTLYTGYSGTGSLTLTDGGRVASNFGQLGVNSSATGTALISGTGSQWTTTNDFYVGVNGKGFLTIADGGHLLNNFGYLGYGSSSVGNATITGAQSVWTLTDDLFVGLNGRGTLTLTGGGRATANVPFLGYYAGSAGEAVVSGTGSELALTGHLHVGFEGQGTLTVTGGGRVSVAEYLNVAYSATATGTAIISGTGSSLTTRTLVVGGGFANPGGTGTMRIESGATVDVEILTRIFGPGSLTIGDGGTFSTGSLTGNLTNNGQLVIGGTNTTSTYGDVISGTGSVVKSGTGTFTFTASQSHLGGTTISGGTLQLGNNTAGISLASDVWADAGTTLQFAISDSLTFNRSVGGAGRLVKLNAGTLNLSGVQTYTGGTTITGGTLRLFGGDDRLATTGTVTLNGGSLDITGTQNVGLVVLNSASSSITGGGMLVAPAYDVRNGTISAQLGGTGGLTKSTTSTVSIGGGNSYSDGTTVLNGTLSVGGNGALGTGAVVIGDTSGGSSTSLLINGGFTVDRNITIRAGSSGGSTLGGTNTSGTSAFSGDILLNKNVTLTAAGGGGVQFLTGTISGTGGVTKMGAGTVLLSGPATYSGGTTILHGTLIVAGNGALGSGTVLLGDVTGSLGSSLLINGGFTVDRNIIVRAGSSVTSTLGGTNTTGTSFFTGDILLNKNVTFTAASGGVVEFLTGTISGSGGITKSGSGMVILSGPATYTGGTTISTGVLKLGGNGGIAASTITNNVSNGLQFASGVNAPTIGGLAGGGGITLQNDSGQAVNLIVGANNGSTTYSGSFLGSGSLTKVGTGALTLTNNHLYSGGTSILGGTLVIGGGSSQGNISNTVRNFGVLSLGGTPNGTYNVSISGTGSLLMQSSGVRTLNGVQSYTGVTTIAAGTLEFVAGASMTNFAGNINNRGTFVYDNPFLSTISGAISGTGSFRKRSDGTLVLTGNNTYSGVTTIDEGAIQIGNGGTTGSIGGGAVANDGLLIVNRSDVVTLSNAVTGAGGLVQAGNGLTILTGSNSYSGGTTISAGILQLGAGGTNGSVTGNIANNGVLLVNRSNLFTLSGVLSGTGILKQIGTGTTALGGANTFTGGVSILRGTLVLDHTTNNAAKLSTGSVVTFGGGRLALLGNASADSTQAVAQIHLQAGQNEIRVQSGGPGRTATIETAALTRSAGATVNYAPTGGGTSVFSTTIANGSGSGSQAIVGGYALVNNSDWAVATGTNLVGLSTVAGGYTVQNDAGLWAAGQNITSSGGRVSGTVAASVAINSLRFDGRPASTFAIAAGQTLDIDSGGILVTDRLSGGSRISISNGTLRGSTAGELIVHQQSTKGGQFLIQSTIADRGGPTGLTKSGPGELMLTHTNTFTGAVVINGGRLTIFEPDNAIRNGGQPSALGASSAAAANLVLNGGTLRLPANMQTDRLFTLGPGGGTIETYGSSQTLNLTNTGAIAFSVPDVAVRLVFDGLEGTTRVSPQLNDNGTGALSIVKRGSTTVELAGTNNFSGGLTIAQGIVRLHYQPFNTDKLGPTSTVTMAGGQLLMSGNTGTGATSFQAAGGLVLDVGKSQITVSSGGVGTAHLSVGAIERRGGATLTYTTGGFGTSIFETTTTNGSGSGAAAVLGGYATYGSGDWAVVDGSGRLVGLSTVTGGYSVQNSVGSWTAGRNITNTGAYTGTLGNDLAINTLRFAVNTTSTISIGEANRLTIASGGILLTGAVNTAQTITGGTLRGSLGGELIINTAASAHNLTIHSVIADNGGPTGLTKSGFGSVTLANVANTYTGATWIHDFNLSVKSLADGGLASSIGASSADASNLVFNGGRLGYSGTGPASTNRSFTIRDLGATLAVDSATSLSIGSAVSPQAVAFGGTLLGTYNLNLEGNSSGTGTLNLIVNDPGPDARTRVTMQAGGMTWILTGSNGYSGGTSLVSGTLRGTNIHAFGTGPILGDTSTGREVEAAGDSNLDFDLDVIAGGGMQLTPDRLTAGSGDGITHSFAYLQSGGNTLSVIGGDNVTSGTITLSIGRLLLTGNLQVNLNDATGGGKTELILGDIEQSSSGFGIRFSATGKAILAGNNSYSGATTVSAGTLEVGDGGTAGNLPGNANISFGNLIFNRSDTYTYAGNITGNSGTVQIDGSGTTIFTGTHTYTGTTTLAAGALRAVDGLSLPTASNLALSGGVLESSGNFNRALGAGANQVRWTSGGGFSAAGADLTVNLGGAAQPLTWGQANFVQAGSSLKFGSSTAGAKTTFVHAINFGGGARTIQVDDNGSSTADVAEITGIISNGSLNKTGPGTLILSADNTYAAGTTIVGGTLQAAHNHALGTGGVVIQNGGKLDVAGGITIDNTLSILSGGSVGGSGTINSHVIIGGGAIVSPGNSPGTQNVATETWASGGNYLWEINDVDAGMGVDPGWDWINVTNQLNITATSGGKFNVLVTSLALSNATGPVHDFNPFSNYSWTLASAGGGVTGFDSAAFNINTAGFQNSFSGTFGVSLVGSDINLVYTAIPEPSSCLLVAAGAAGLAWRRRRRKLRVAPATSTMVADVGPA